MSRGETLVLLANKNVESIIGIGETAMALEDISSKTTHAIFRECFDYVKIAITPTLDYYRGTELLNHYAKYGVLVLYSSNFRECFKFEILKKEYPIILHKYETIGRKTLGAALGVVSEGELPKRISYKKAIEIQEEIMKELALRKSFKVNIFD